MPPGRPKRDEPTCVLAVRVPVALRDALDRSLDALETRVGLKARRNAISRHALRLFLATQQPAGRLTPPPHLDEPSGCRTAGRERPASAQRSLVLPDPPGGLELGAGACGLRRRVYCRRGFRKAARHSGVRVTPHGPRGATCRPSRLPALHQSAIVATDTLRRAAAAWAL